MQLDELNSQLQELEAYRIESKITIPEKIFGVTTIMMSAKLLICGRVTNFNTDVPCFLRAMILHKLLLIANNTTIYYAINDFKDRRKLIDANPDKVHNAWNVMHLIFPVVSTTFASFKSMYGGIPKDFIDYLFIDEAGQAIPQAAVGALYRSKSCSCR